MSQDDEFEKIVKATIEVVDDRYQRDQGYLMEIANALGIGGQFQVRSHDSVRKNPYKRFI